MSDPRRVVVITGAGGTLGAALSQQFAGEPETDVVLSDVSASSLAATVAGLPKARGAVETLGADVGDFAQVEAVVALAVARFGRLDVLISNAGVLAPNGRIHNLATEDWERSFRVNVLGAVNGIKAAVPVMRAQRSGSIVLTASVSGLTAWSHAAPYCATKAAVIQLAKVAAVEYAREGIRVNCVCPGTFRSGIHDDLPAEALDAIAAKHPLGLGSRGRPDGRVLVPRQRRLPLDDRVRDRGRRRLLRAVRSDPLMPPMHPDMSWVAVLEHHAIRTPDQALAIFGGEEVTYGEMTTRAAALAVGLTERGVGAGDVVGLLSYNCTEFLETIFAANSLGGIAMPINWRLAAPELRYILDHSEARALVCDESLVDLANEAIKDMERDLVRVCIAPTAPEGWTPLAALRSVSSIPVRVPAAGDDIHRLMYTSGTTGRPKGVMLSHANLAWKNLAHIVEFGFTSADLGLVCGPLYHVGALDLTTTSLIAAGATTIIHRVFDASDVVDEIERSRVTTVWLAPAMVNAIMALPDIEARDLSSVRLIINGGEKMPIPLIERIQRVFPSAWFADAYGLTETVSGDTFLDRDSIVRKLGSVGRPCLYLELDIWDDEGASVPPGERGEVVLRGPKVFKGYWRDPDATATAFAGGWFHTGDIGVRDDDGYLFIVDRLKDMIVSGGENIASSEIERVLYEHESVVEAAVVGRPDDRWGEVPVAYVVLGANANATPEALVEHCRAQLARFKVPKEVMLVDALPRNPSGKVLKRELRDRTP